MIRATYLCAFALVMIGSYDASLAQLPSAGADCFNATLTAQVFVSRVWSNLPFDATGEMVLSGPVRLLRGPFQPRVGGEQVAEATVTEATLVGHLSAIGSDPGQQFGTDVDARLLGYGQGMGEISTATGGPPFGSWFAFYLEFRTPSDRLATRVPLGFEQMALAGVPFPSGTQHTLPAGFSIPLVDLAEISDPAPLVFGRILAATFTNESVSRCVRVPETTALWLR